MYSEVIWKIRLNSDREARHEIEIEIFDYEPQRIPPIIRFNFKTTSQISSFQSSVNGQNLSWKRKASLQEGESKAYFCEIAEIAKLYELPQNSLKASITFDEQNAFLQYGDFSIVNFQYHCGDLKASTIVVDIHLPPISYFRHLFLKPVAWFYRKKAGSGPHKIGIYRIYEGSGGQTQKWDSIKGGHNPVLKFRNPRDFSGFPLISFGYEMVSPHLFSMIFGFLIACVTLFLLPIITNLISSEQWVKETYEKLRDLLLKSGSMGKGK